MIKFLLFGLLAYWLYRTVKRVFPGEKELPRHQETGAIDEMVQDPFCGTYIPLREARRRVIQGKEHFFCSRECEEKFEKQAEKEKT